MSNEDKSLDFTGIGKLAKSIPASSWNKLVKTACDTFSEILAPITSTTTGLGRLIQAKFDGMVDAQKILSTDAIRRAKEKVDKTGRQPKGNPKAVILLRSIENAANETDDNIREIWANLIANEILENQVHPEFPRLLERLSANDAIVLAELAKKSRKEKVKIAAVAYSVKLAFMTVSFDVEEEADFSREHLKNLNLIKARSGKWKLTRIGEDFLRAVADPSFEYVDADHGTPTEG